VKRSGGRFGHRRRGEGVSRLEGLSDGVFALALTFLVFITRQPADFDDFLSLLRGFLPFGLTFAMLFTFWNTQNTFFRRYGLDDGFTKWMNALLLFCILFFTFPLKYLFAIALSALLSWNASPAGSMVFTIRADQVPWIAILFGAGLAVIFTIFALLYGHAYRLRDRLALTGEERVEARGDISRCVLTVAVSLLSCAIVSAGGVRRFSLSGQVYLILPVAFAIVGHRSRRAVRRLRLEEEESAAREGEESGPDSPERIS